MAFHTQGKHIFAADTPVGPVCLAKHCNEVIDNITTNFDCTMQIHPNGVASGYTVPNALQWHSSLN